MSMLTSAAPPVTTAAPRDPSPIVAARGPQLRACSCRAEGLLRMLENVLEVVPSPDDLICCASLARAARDHESYRRIRVELLALDSLDTLVLQRVGGRSASSPPARWPAGGLGGEQHGWAADRPR